LPVWVNFRVNNSKTVQHQEKAHPYHVLHRMASIRSP